MLKMGKVIISMTPKSFYRKNTIFGFFINFRDHSQKGRASPGLLLALIAAHWVQGVTNSDKGGTWSGTMCDRVGYKV